MYTFGSLLSVKCFHIFLIFPQSSNPGKDRKLTVDVLKLASQQTDHLEGIVDRRDRGLKILGKVCVVNEVFVVVVVYSSYTLTGSL